MTGRPKPRRTDQYGYTARVRLRVHRHADLLADTPGFDDLSPRDKLAVLRRVAPLYEEERSNITTENLIRHVTDKLLGQAVADASNYAVGSGTTPPAITDTDLVTREETKAFTLTNDAGLTLETSTFWDTGEGNGITFAEGGILAGGTVGVPGSGGVLLARVVFASPTTKDSTKTITIDHDLTGTPK